MNVPTAGGPKSRVPDLRVHQENDAPVRSDADFVLYWMTSTRRTTDNFALDRAREWAEELSLPLLVFEPLRVAYPHASARIHRFVIDGMRDNAARFGKSPVGYFPYVEPEAGAGRGLLEALAGHAAVVVTDLYPTFFLPRMRAAAAKRLPVRLEAVDSYGLIPLRAGERKFTTAASYRRFVQKGALVHLTATPRVDPLRRLALPPMLPLPRVIAERWQSASVDMLSGDAIEALPIDHSVSPVGVAGGARAGSRAWNQFLKHGLQNYLGRNHPDDSSQSGASFWLHFGHLSPHRMFRDIAKREDFFLEYLEGRRVTGSRAGFWSLSPEAEAFVDQLLTWREVAANGAYFDADHRRFESLPAWARKTLDEHADDPRPIIYSREQLECAQTGDEIWNAAQSELVRDGRIHNYLRMLWGKRILEWSPSPREALDTMIELNDKYAVDGRDPSSYGGIFWVLGRYDRAWGPERPIFGKVRYMSSAATRRKLRLRGYLERYGE